MVYNLISVKRVIAKVLADNDVGDSANRITDMVEWCGEAIEKIGAVGIFKVKITGKDNVPLLQITDYQTQLPGDFYSFVQVAFGTATDSEVFYPMRYATGSYDSFREEATESTLNYAGDYSYYIKPGYIVTSEKDGYLMLAYRYIPMDDMGYPMVPDEIGFIDALYWYITTKLLYADWARGKVRDAVYYEAKRSWNFYRKQAYGNSMMPDQGQLESIKNQQNRLIPDLNSADTYFTTLGHEEVYRRH